MLQKNWNDSRYNVYVFDAFSQEKELVENIHTAVDLLFYSVGLVTCIMVFNR